MLICSGAVLRSTEQVVRDYGLRETSHYDPKLVDMLIARVQQARKEERRTWGGGKAIKAYRAVARRPAGRLSGPLPDTPQPKPSPGCRPVNWT